MISDTDKSRIQKEVVLGMPIARPDTIEEAEYRRGMEADIKRARDLGVVLDAPKDFDFD